MRQYFGKQISTVDTGGLPIVKTSCRLQMTVKSGHSDNVGGDLLNVLVGRAI